MFLMLETLEKEKPEKLKYCGKDSHTARANTFLWRAFLANLLTSDCEMTVLITKSHYILLPSPVTFMSLRSPRDGHKMPFKSLLSRESTLHPRQNLFQVLKVDRGDSIWFGQGCK